MCGIAGVVGTEGGRETVEDMLETIGHRGPDDSGVWQGSGVVLGLRRLAVIDPSLRGHQPMVTPDARHVLVFNGEIYNHDELRERLSGQGERFASRSDTEVVLKALARWGVDALDRFVGMFGFAWWDRHERVLTLARDRLGEKPLYYAQQGSRFAFASELQALRCLSWVSSEIDREALGLYLTFRHVPAPWTIFTGARKLLPGEVARFDGSTLTRRRYWNARDFLTEPRIQITPREAQRRLQDLVTRSVGQQLVADVPVGLFLSGGTDSALVAATAARLSSTPIKTFTVGFSAPEHDESGRAARIATLVGADHTHRVCESENLATLTQQACMLYGEPFGDSSAVPTLLVSALAQEKVTVVLTGDGGDECFGGYARYGRLQQAARLSRLIKPVWPLLKPAVSRMGRRGARIASIEGFTPASLHRMALSVIPEARVAAMTGIAPAPYPPVDSWQRGGSARRDAMISDLTSYLPDQLLTKVDRASMSVGLETRAPLLDHRLVEFSLRLPDSLLVDKELTRAALSAQLPGFDVGAPKQGFTVPLGRWLRGELAELLRDTVTAARLRARGILDPRPAMELVAAHLAGGECADQMWLLLSLCLWEPDGVVQGRSCLKQR